MNCLFDGHTRLHGVSILTIAMPFTCNKYPPPIFSFFFFFSFSLLKLIMDLSLTKVITTK